MYIHTYNNTVGHCIRGIRSTADSNEQPYMYSCLCTCTLITHDKTNYNNMLFIKLFQCGLSFSLPPSLNLAQMGFGPG